MIRDGRRVKNAGGGVDFHLDFGYSPHMPKPDAPVETEADAEFLAAVREGIASLDAGKGIPYEKIRRWLLSWGTENELPPPDE